MIQATLNGAPIALEGGFHQVNKGYLATVIKPDNSRETVSFTALDFPNIATMRQAFIDIYRINIERAMSKGHRKGVPAIAEKSEHEKNIYLEECVETSDGLDFNGQRLAILSA